MTDPRIAPVEDNLDGYLESLIRSGAFATGSDPDVWNYWSDVPFPLFNAIGAARFAPGTLERRAREVVQPYLSRGLPFMWWATPSGHADELEPVLAELGLACDPVPGMYVELDGPLEPDVPAGVTFEEVSEEPLIPLMMAGFEMPDLVREPLRKFVAAPPAERMVHLVARLDGRDVACGTLWLTGTTAGLYNIATLEEARGRGIGSALTTALMRIGRQRGATYAVLHSSPAGRSVYGRLGFTEVCVVPQFVWLPPDDDS
jgi:GNAT superfamily N-acetyltransferase